MKFTILTVSIIGLLTGCNSTAPKCNAPETIALVKEITNNEMIKEVGKDAASGFTYNLTAIRTTAKNKDVGSYECAANLKINHKNGSQDADVTYKVEKTDDGKQFYVTVFGL